MFELLDSSTRTNRNSPNSRGVVIGYVDMT